MAIIKVRGNALHIQWYDPVEKKVKTKSTGLENTPANMKKAEAYAKKLQDELTKRNKKLKEMGIRHITIKDAFEHFLRNNQHKNPKTIADYHRFYRKFIERFNENLPVNTAVNKLSVEDWLNEIKKLPLKQNSVHGYGKQLIHFLNFLFEYSYAPVFIINKEVRTRREIVEKIIFSDEDISLIFEKLDTKNSNFSTFIYLAFYTGLRSSDMLTITGDRVNLKEKTFRYYPPKLAKSRKEDKFREIPFHKDLLPILKKRIAEVGNGQLLDYDNVDNMAKAVRRFFQDIGIKSKGYTSRTFRKTFVTRARKLGMDSAVVRYLVGHELKGIEDIHYFKVDDLGYLRQELQKFKKPKPPRRKAAKTRRPS